MTDDTSAPSAPRVLVACFGNVLRGDDGFGNVVAERLAIGRLPDAVRVMEVGIGGIHLVQELLEGFDAIVVVDAVDLGRSPGTVVVLEPDVLDVTELPLSARRDELADMHYATPERALMLAKAMDVLPATVWLVGAQVTSPEQLGEGLSEPLAGAIEDAVAEIRHIVDGLGVPWPGKPRTQ